MAQDANDTVTKALPLGGVSDTLEFSMHEPPAEVDTDLLTVLAWPRGHDTASEKMFCGWLFEKLRNLGAQAVRRGPMETIICEVPMPDGKQSDVLFACHVDTMDSQSVKLDATAGSIMKKLAYDQNFGHIFLDKAGKIGECLGADDGVGVWILLKMIEAKVPGSYVFNRGEERGGLGSVAMRQGQSAWLKQFSICVEFDRPGFDEVITHQRGRSRCASDKFGEALVKALNATNEHFAYKVSDAGVFTDNFNWRDVIAECVNVAVGYSKQHGPSEVLDYGHAHALMQACLKLDWNSLPVDRTPELSGGSYYGRSYKGVYTGDYDDLDEHYNSLWGTSRWQQEAKAIKDARAEYEAKKAAHYDKPKVTELHPKGNGKKSGKGKQGPVSQPGNIEDEVLCLDFGDLSTYCFEDDVGAAQLLIDLATECRALREKVKAMKRYIGS